MTLSERRLWNALKKRQLGGAKFSRQMAIGPYICDFLCREHALIVEVDGHVHDFRVVEDEVRTRYLRAKGFKLIRATNDEVTFDLDRVLRRIAAGLPTPALRATPPAHGRGDT